MAENFKTLGDMFDYYYGNNATQNVGYKTFDVKKDANITSSVTGVYNPIHGAQVFEQFNLKANTLGALPKLVMDRTGIRVNTTPSSTSGTGGVAEDGTIPDTVKPTFSIFSRKPKEIAHTFSVSNRQQLISKMQDDAPIDMAYMREYFGREHPKQMNYMLNTSVDTLAGNNLESLDRVVSSYAEVTNCSITAGDSDIYGIDRDAAASWADAYVSHNSGTTRTLTLDLIRTVKRNTVNKGATPTVIITGDSTAQKIDQLLDQQARYTVVDGGRTKMKLTANGVMTGGAIEGGFSVATLFGEPIIEDTDVVTHTNASANLYYLDTTSDMGMPKLGLAMAQPTSYYEYGLNKSDPSGINRLGTEGMYLTAGELHCSKFLHQGKLRDITA